jgi:general secretion pathway protein D
MDNTEAKIEIGDEIPIATGFQQQPSTSTTTGTTAFVAAGQIQYRTTGILLTVLPNISEKNSVKLKISQEISNRGVDIALAGITSPSFTKRKAETVGIVENGHTLIIGGLISEQNNNSREGIPLLSRIPLIGYLFGVLSDEIKKTELLIMVTPHVAGSPEEADKITRDFQYRVKTISKKIDMEKAERKKDEAVKQESSKEQE